MNLYFAKFCTNMKYHKIKCGTFILCISKNKQFVYTINKYGIFYKIYRKTKFFRI